MSVLSESLLPKQSEQLHRQILKESSSTKEQNEVKLERNLKKQNKAKQLIRHYRGKSELQFIQQLKPQEKTKDSKDKAAVKFARKSLQKACKKPVENSKFLSPPAKEQIKNKILIHQPPKQKEEQKSKLQPKQRGFHREVIPPSDLVHQKMKNFEQDPEKFILDINEGLQNVFKKSIDSVIRTAKVIPVKDWQIRDSTDLLDGFNDQ